MINTTSNSLLISSHNQSIFKFHQVVFLLFFFFQIKVQNGFFIWLLWLICFILDNFSHKLFNVIDLLKKHNHLLYNSLECSTFWNSFFFNAFMVLTFPSRSFILFCLYYLEAWFYSSSIFKDEYLWICIFFIAS